MKNKLSVSFIARKALQKKNGYIPIYCKVRYNKISIQFNTKMDLLYSEWDSANTRAIGLNKNHINIELETIRVNIIEKYNELIKTNVIITCKVIVEYYKNDSMIMNTIINVFEEHNKHMKSLIDKQYSYGTYKNYINTLKRLKEFIKKTYKEDDMSISKINYDFLYKFSQYILIESQCTNNGMMKHMQRLKKVTNLCIKNQYITYDPFNGFHINLKPSNRMYLTMDELHTITDLELNESLMKVRDVFLCACYTGLSYADIKKLNKTHIKKGDDNFMWIYINRDKTNIPCNIPLLPKAESLINKYMELCNSDVIFPVISNQKTNKYLKQIASICGIDKNITFHSARHTFATTITLCNGMPIETVSKMLGHNNIKTTQIYARVIDSKVSSDMQVLRQKFM